MDLPLWLSNLFAVLLHLLPGGLWMAFWLWAVNWKKTWKVLAEGGWAPVLLLMYLSALVWSRIAPSECTCLGFVTLPNFWWQMGSVSALAAVALFSGWLQGVIHFTPLEVNFEPPAHEHGHDAHGHGHHAHDHQDHGHESHHEDHAQHGHH